MHIALKGCRPPHTNEPVQFWIGFGLVLIGGSGLNPLGLLTPHWIIQQVIDRNASRRHMGPIYSSDLRSRAKRRWTKSKILFSMHELTNYRQLSQMFAVVMIEFTIRYFL